MNQKTPPGHSEAHSTAHGPSQAATPMAGHLPGDTAAGDAVAMKQAEPPSGKSLTYDFGLLSTDVSARGKPAIDGGHERPWPPYAKLRSVRPTALDPSKPVRQIRLTLDGDMRRYVWFMNMKALSEADDILIRQGEIVRFIMINRTMMHHPMHLHGHFFRVVNGQGDHAPLKHTVDVAPMSTTVIEFDANETGDWFFHCHLLYHMKAGMSRLIHYEGYRPSPEVEAIRPDLYRDAWYAWVEADILTNMTEGELQVASTRHMLGLKWEAGWRKVDETEWEAIATWDYYLDRFKSLFLGADALGSESETEKVRGVGGLRLLMPFNLETTVWVDTDLGFRASLAREFALTPRLGLFGEVQYDTHDKWEGEAGLDYMLNGNLSLVAKWHSEYGWGAGLRVSF